MPHQSLYQSVFNHENPAMDVVKELEQVTKEFPYFGLAHFFLLKNIPADHEDAAAIAAKTSLHFNNPYLLSQQLKREVKNFSEETVPETEEEEIIPEPAAVEIEEKVIENVETTIPVEMPEENSPAEVPEPIAEITDTVITPEPEIEEEQKQEEEIAAAVTAEKIETVPSPVLKEEKAELLFEPLYTTDYFASQGIKLSDEVQPTDKLGKQLKSFTEWLKTMKKVHDSKLPEGSDQLDASVNKLAEKSNKDEEVITEAMAEAYIIQGKPEKAKDVYLKLSLQNPSKNAYFAAKIDQIAW